MENTTLSANYQKEVGLGSNSSHCGENLKKSGKYVKIPKFGWRQNVFCPQIFLISNDCMEDSALRIQNLSEIDFVYFSINF